MLGPQFKDTYYEDESGTQKSFISGDEGRVTEVAGPVMAGRSLQGMLFHPATATGTKADPMVSPEQRTAAIESGYKLDKESHAQSHQTETKKSAGSRKLETDRQLSIGSIRESGIPISEMQRSENPAVVASSASSYRTSAGGHYSPRNHLAWTKTESRKEKVVTEGAKVPTAGTGELMVNPKPLQGGDVYAGGGHRFEGYFHEMGEFDPVADKPTPPTEESYARHERAMEGYEEKSADYERYQQARAAGERAVYVSRPFKPIHPDVYHTSAMRDYEANVAARVEGVGPEHLFTKPAPDTNPNVFSEHIGGGHKYLSQGGDTDTDYYTRQPASEWETKSVTSWKNVNSASESTMVHEIGHGVHMQGWVDPSSNREYNRGADPFEESQADAYADMYSRYSDKTAEAADPATPQRNIDLTVGGYGSASSLWSNDTERALYRVARHAATTGGDLLPKDYKKSAMKEATGGEGHKGGVDESHLDYINRSNTMALGRLMSENPQFSDAFTYHEAEGRYASEKHLSLMSGAANKAKEAYEGARNKRFKTPKTEQLSLGLDL